MGGLLRAARTLAGLEPGYVAKMLGVKTNTYLSWERGHAYMPIYQLEPVCMLFHCTPASLIADKRNGDWVGGMESSAFPAFNSPSES